MKHLPDTTPITPDDPRLTALALGEPVDEAFEAAVAADPALQAEVDQIRAFSTNLGDVFATEAAETAPKAARPEPRQHGKIVSFLTWKGLRGPLSVGIAACAVMAIMVNLREKPAPAPQSVGIEMPLGDKPLADDKTRQEAIAAFNKAKDDADAQKKEEESRRAAARMQALTAEDVGPEVAVASTSPKPDGVLKMQISAPAPVAAMPPPPPAQGDSLVLSPFSVTTDTDKGYMSTKTLAGSRLQSELRDVPAGLTVVHGASTMPGGYIGPQAEPPNREAYDSITETGFVSPLNDPLSTFSVDVDTASYANVRRMLRSGMDVPAGAVRIEEMVNYFDYGYAPPKDKAHPFAVHLEATTAPWAPEHQLVRIGLKGYEVPWAGRPAGNFVFLVDVSGSMNSADKLPLVQEGLKMLVKRLDARDRVAIVTYAGADRLALPSTTANNTETITAAIDGLSAGGSTNGASGIRTAYEQATAHFIKGGVNRVILCTDGDFNVGTTSRSDLVDLITREAKSGVFLSVYGFGTGNLQDATMEQLADNGNGNYGYVDSADEARRIFVQGAAGNLITIAKDVKIQVEFNPQLVQAYRLIGYEDRKLAAQDFNDDRKDAGEIGAGHSVTALYEVIPVGVKWEQPSSVDALKYQKITPPADALPMRDGELLTVKLRYKLPDADTSSKLEVPLAARSVVAFSKAGEATRWASAVAEFGLLLRGSEYAGRASLDQVLQVAKGAIGGDMAAERVEFIDLVNAARGHLPARGGAEKAPPVPGAGAD